MARQFVAGKRFFLDEFGVECRGGLAARLLRLLGRPAADRQGRRQRVVPDPEDLLEPDQPDAAPHLQLGGHRRHPGLHPLPAGRHLQLGPQRPGAGPRRAQLPGPRPRHDLAGAVRIRRRRRRTDPRDAGRGAPHRGPGGLADGANSARPPASSPRPRPSTKRCPSGSARCTSSCTAAPTPPRPRPSRATGAASTCCARPSCGRHGRRADRVRLPVRGAQAALADGAAAAVPRHPARQLDRLGAPRRRAELRRRRAASWRRSSPTPPAALLGTGGRGLPAQRRPARAPRRARAAPRPSRSAPGSRWWSPTRPAATSWTTASSGP